jgi:hypothetical protein
VAHSQGRAPRSLPLQGSLAKLATTPMTVLEPPSGAIFSAIGVSSSGYLAAIEYETSSFNGPVVVYAPGTTAPSTTISAGLQDPLQVVFGN